MSEAKTAIAVAVSLLSSCMLAISILYRDLISILVMLLSALAFVISLARVAKYQIVVFLTGCLFVLASTYPMILTTLTLWESSIDDRWPSLAWLFGYVVIALAALMSVSRLVRRFASRSSPDGS